MIKCLYTWFKPTLHQFQSNSTKRTLLNKSSGQDMTEKKVIEELKEKRESKPRKIQLELRRNLLQRTIVRQLQ